METSVANKTAVWGGVCLSILGNLAWQDVIKTVVLGVIGTCVSFFISALLSRIFRRRKG